MNIYLISHSINSLMDAYILSAKRTAIGSFMGALSSIPAPQLGSQVIKSLLRIDNNKTILPIEDIQECFMGQVLTAGSGQAPARQSALYAG
ncbi:MAG: hypothetical protein OXC37_01320, partial [Bdellovibrionaceae bacterium]|nr:hypothetical protein [Pseudobdellovibrionaceae bacterium]